MFTLLIFMIIVVSKCHINLTSCLWT